MAGEITAAVLLMPVQILGIVETEFQTVLITGLGQFSYHVAAKGRGVHHVEAVGPGMEEGEAVVVLAGHDEILHPAFLCQTDPLVRVKIHRVKGRCQLVVFCHGDPLVGLDPFRIAAAFFSVPFSAQKGIQSPVGHHAVLGLFKPFSHIHFQYLR